jgi:hypothetical protein
VAQVILCVPEKNGRSQMLDQDRNEKYSKGDFESEIFDF